MMTLSRIGGKVLKNAGWWQFLLLGGVWAWFSTPVDAQQKVIHAAQNQVARGFDRDEDDSFAQPGFLGRSAAPLNSRPEGYEARPARRPSNRSRNYQDREAPQEERGSFERIDMRPQAGTSDWGYGPAPRSRNEFGARNESRYAPQPHRTNRNVNPDAYVPMDRGQQFPNFNPQDDSFGVQKSRMRDFEEQRMTPENSGYWSPSFQNPSSPNTTPRIIPQESVNPAQEIQTKITRRYQNQGFLSLLNLQPQQSIALYSEVLKMIDTRHLDPTPLQARVQRGVTNLMYALDNPTFMQTNQISVQGPAVQAFRAGLQQAMQSPVQSEQDAIQLLNWTMQVSQQQVGLRPSATALEFVYGAVESLDKYSAFLPPEKNTGASLQLETNMVGIGVQIEMRDQGAEVMKVISGSPAQGAGMQKGDMILAVGGRQLGGLTVDETVNLITGPSGSPVVLGVQRRNQGPFTMTVNRQQIQLHTVNDVQLLNGSKVGYLKLDKFTASANDEIEAALQQLYRQGMQSLVMDLRGNPGGLLTAAIQISDKFLPEGTIVATRGRTPSDNTEEHATRDRTWKIPLVVLVDQNSASASEIFAAAIQENRRGVVVGRTSYGKGTVQTQFPLQTAGCSLRITTAKFYSPNGREMAGNGVIPDVPVAEDLNGNDQSYGILDQDVQAALGIAQQGGFSNPRGTPNGNPARNQNLSSTRGFSQPFAPQTFSQPRSPAGR